MTDITNPILSAILAALDAHIDARIKQALTPLNNHIACVDTDVKWVKDCIEDGGNIANLFNRVATLEVGTKAATPTPAEPAAPVDMTALVDYLDKQEWFWEKMQRFTNTAIEEAMADHTQTYDHDDYDNAASNLSDYDLDSFVTREDLDDDLSDKVRDAVRDLRFDINVEVR